MTIAKTGFDEDDRLRQSNIGDWLWRPLHARIWWIAIPFYWAGSAASSHFELLANIYSSAFVGLVNIFFNPPLVALILLYGFFKSWLATENCDLDGDAEECLEWTRERHGPTGMLREFDPLDPASGSNWIGSPLNPSHPFYVIRHRHSS